MSLTHIPPQPHSDGLDIYADSDGQIWARSPVSGYGTILGEGEPGLGGGLTQYGIGLTKTGRTVDLDPARPLPGEIGGINEPVPSDLIIYGRQYTTAGVASWVEVKASGITISDTPPANPIHEDMWWDSDDGNTFIYYNDGTSAQWVQTAPGTGGRDLPLFFDIGLTRTGLVVNLDPATNLIIGGITEPTPDGLAYSRQWDNVTDPVNPKWVWVPALTAGLQITSIIPDKAIYGPGEPLLTVHAYGAEFTPTTVAVLDGRDIATTVLSTTELTFVLNPAVPISEQFHIITVRDPAAVPPDPVNGLGAEQFDFIKASTEVDYGRGLSLDTLPTPPIVNLDPAGPTNMGGVIVPIRDGRTTGLVIDMGNVALGDPATGHLTAPPATNSLLGTVWVPVRSPINGLHLGGQGDLQAPLANHEDAGTIVEPKEEGKQFARFRDPTTHINQWVEVEAGMEEPPMDPVALWGRSNGGDRGWLPIPEPPPGMEEPPMEPVQTWGRSSGGVRGWLPIPESTQGMEEPPMEPVTLWGRSSGGVRGWLEGVSRQELDGKVDKFGDTMTGFLTLHAPPIYPLHAATKDYVDLSEPQEAPYNGKTYARKDGQWVEIQDTGDVIEEPPMEPVALWARSSGGARGWLEIPPASPGMEEPPAEPVAVWGRTSAGARGWAEVPTFDHLTGFVEKIGDTMLGKLTLDGPPIYPLHAATKDYVDLSEPQEAPHDGKQYVRQNGQWVEVDIQDGMEEPPMDPVTIWGRSSGGVRSWLPIPEQILDSMEEPPMEPVQTWGRSSGGVRGWLAIPETTIDAGRGLTLSDDGKIIHLDVATQTTLGGVMIAPQPGLNIDQSGNLTLARATPEDIGGLKDAPRDDTGQKQYARKWGEWVEVSDTGGGMEEPPMDPPTIWGRSSGGARGWIELPHVSPIDYRVGLTTTYDSNIDTLYIDLHPANVDGEIGGVKVVGRGPTQGLEYDIVTGTLWAPLATAVAAGSIVEPPADGLQYARSNDVMAGPVWVPTTSGGVVIGDAPPATPVPGGLWWDSDSGATYLWYTDVDSSQWVQVASSSTGIEEAPINNTPHVRQNAMWLPTALTTTAGDVKSGFQTVDHGGWILLDGRAVSTLTVTQQDQAALLGFTANLPNAALCGLRQDSAAAPGVVGGSAKIAVTNLPAHNMTAASAGASTPTTSSAGATTGTTSNALNFTDLVGPGPQTGKIASGGTGQYYIRADTVNTRDYNHTHTVTVPAHTHTVSVPAHTHTVALGGSGTDYYAKAMVVNFFLYLGL